jgi:hypothetical protein
MTRTESSVAGPCLGALSTSGGRGQGGEAAVGKEECGGAVDTSTVILLSNLGRVLPSEPQQCDGQPVEGASP